ncbi:hypothetical protein HDU78_011406 [Chytriomyces hyalinus]|nr:hypothetical protein HDU78_011406 [Chytriomyces hyalinus]
MTNDEYERHTTPPSCVHQTTQRATESHSASTAAPILASVPAVPPTVPINDVDTDTAPLRAPAAPRWNGTRTLSPAPVKNSLSKPAEALLTQIRESAAAAAEELERQITDSVKETRTLTVPRNRILQACFSAEDDVLETDKENAVPERIDVTEGDSAKDAQRGSSACSAHSSNSLNRKSPLKDHHQIHAPSTASSSSSKAQKRPRAETASASYGDSRHLAKKPPTRLRNSNVLSDILPNNKDQ